jgi:hypothetical protein
LSPPEVDHAPDAFVPVSPLSTIIVFVEPVVLVLLVEPVVLEPLVLVLLVEPVVLEPLVEPDEVVALVGANWTASAQVVKLLDLETTTTFAFPENV